VTRILTAEQMRALDRATIDGGHAAGAELMERAGAGVVAAMERRYGPMLALRVLVLCGSGNNGGDGFIAARHLARRGADVVVGLAGDPERVRGDARVALDRLVETGIAPVRVGGEAELERLIGSRDQWDFALDALLGTGARGVPEGAIADAVQALRDLDDRGTRVIAVDLPTGVDADTGAVARRAVRADLTVTFGAVKRGHVLYPGRAFAGTLEIVDIGLLEVEPGATERCVELASGPEMAARVPRRDPRTHKGTAGRVLVIGGSAGLTGAPTLTARAASRTGAGYVQVAVPASVSDILAIKLLEEMPIACPETSSRALSLAAWDELSRRAGGVHVVALGPGLSRDPETAELTRRLVAKVETPMVVDADGLNAFEARSAEIAAAAGPRILTPHIGEMARLTGVGAEELERTRIDAALEWAQRWRAIVVLKGAPTVIASPDGEATINPTGNPGMATAGMGDVLTGVIAALVAQGVSPYDAARLGAFAHGMAGDRVAGIRGQHGLDAGDVVEAMPFALRDLVALRDETPARHGKRPGR
jgi:NAD(P)H-hydrate epimerase